MHNEMESKLELRNNLHDNDLLQWPLKTDGAHYFTQSTLYTAEKILLTTMTK